MTHYKNNIICKIALLTFLAVFLVIFFVKQPNFTTQISIEGNVFVTNTTAKDKPRTIVVSEYDPTISYRLPWDAFVKSTSIDWFNDTVGRYNVNFTYTTPADVILYSLEDCEAYKLIKIDKTPAKIRQDISLTLKTNCENRRAPEASGDMSKESNIVGYYLVNGINGSENKNFTAEEIQDIRNALQNSKSYQRDAEGTQLPDDKLKRYLVAHWYFISAEYKDHLYDLGNCIKKSNEILSKYGLLFFYVPYNEYRTIISANTSYSSGFDYHWLNIYPYYEFSTEQLIVNINQLKERSSGNAGLSDVLRTCQNANELLQRNYDFHAVLNNYQTSS